jgi:hypothetical protein
MEPKVVQVDYYREAGSTGVYHKERGDRDTLHCLAVDIRLKVVEGIQKEAVLCIQVQLTQGAVGHIH